jgi:hypothetical protein
MHVVVGVAHTAPRHTRPGQQSASTQDSEARRQTQYRLVLWQVIWPQHPVPRQGLPGPMQHCLVVGLGAH